MAKIMCELYTEYIDTFDVLNNPEIMLLMAEHDDAECEVTESFWRAGLAVTKPLSNDY